VTYTTFTLPNNPIARAARIAHERSQGGNIYQRPDASLVLVRTRWPYPLSSLVAIDAIPGNWLEISS